MTRQSSQSDAVIFVVDDDAYFNKLLTTMVERICDRNRIPVKIHAYESGRDCMTHLHLSPSLLLLDFYLDARNDITATAYDLLQDIHKKLPHAFILLISQQEDWSRFRDDLIEAGANDFLHKGSDLEERLEEILNQELKEK